MKRTFDIIAAFTGLLLLSPLVLLVALFVKIESRGPMFFKQERMGKGFKPFRIYKFRTMAKAAPFRDKPLTIGDDPRITRVGRILRQTKLDEIPQLINVLRGEMSLVGPRPEVPQYVELFRKDYAEILTVRPGITDLASLKYRDEAAILGRAVDPDGEYIHRILPDKIALSKEYLRRSTFVFDITLILKTLSRLFASKVPGDELGLHNSSRHS